MYLGTLRLVLELTKILRQVLQCSLAPYWSKQLSSTVLEATQLSAQGGYFKVSKNNCGGIELMVNVVLKRVVNISEYNAK